MNYGWRGQFISFSDDKFLTIFGVNMTATICIWFSLILKNIPTDRYLNDRKRSKQGILLDIEQMWRFLGLYTNMKYDIRENNNKYIITTITWLLSNHKCVCVCVCVCLCVCFINGVYIKTRFSWCSIFKGILRMPACAGLVVGERNRTKKLLWCSPAQSLPRYSEYPWPNWSSAVDQRSLAPGSNISSVLSRRFCLIFYLVILVFTSFDALSLRWRFKSNRPICIVREFR